MKRIIKILGIVVLILILAIIAIPFLFKGNIKDIVRQTINNHVNAKVDFADVDISLFRSFPKASVIIDELSVINSAPFEGDTLIYSKRIALDMSITDLFKDASETIGVKEIRIDNAHVAIKVDSLGRANYDIAKQNSEETTPEESSDGGFGFRLEHYEINDAKISYQDAGSKTHLNIANLNHSGNGTFAGENMELDTKTNGTFSFGSGDSNYLEQYPLELVAKLGLDLENSKYTFKENEMLLNELPLNFDGFVQLHEKNTEVDITFKTPSSDFKQFLGAVPKAYAKNLDGVKTSGDFVIKGMVKGIVDDTYIPKMDIQITSSNAAFQYPDLPKGVDNISIDTRIKNDTGLLKDLYVTIGNLTFRIDRDVFAAKGTLRNVTENMLVDMAAKGTLNLANLDSAYPLELEQKLNGMLNVDLTTKFDMQSLEKEQYQNINSAGTASITDFRYASEDIPNEVQIASAKVDFSPETIQLDKMTATTGKSDMTASGKIDNLMGFLFSKQDLKGLFEVSSNTFAVSDFMVAEDDSSEESPTSADEAEALKIPSFLDVTLNFDAKKVLYDNLVLQNAKGVVKIKDETAYLQNVTTNMFDGNIAFDGKVSTKEETPTFDMKVDMNKVDIAKSFNSLDMIKGIAPIAQALQGALTTNFKLSGNLNDDLTPQLNTLKGNALANILNAKVDSNKAPLVSNLNQKLNFLDLDKLNLKNLKTKLDFSDGKVNVAPFDFMVKDIKFTASGSHGFDLNMNHNVQMQVPAKYLGSQVGGLLSQLSEQDQNNMNVTLPVGLTGSFNSPKVNMNMKQAVGDLTQQIVAKQKSKIKDKVKDEVKTKITEQVKGKGGEILGNLLGGSEKKASDTTTATTPKKTQDVVKDAAKNVLGGLFGKKKKAQDTTKTDD